MVEVARLPHPIVSFIDGVDKVCEDDGDVYSASVLDIEGCPGLGLRIASTDDDAVVDRLDPSCYKLGVISASAYILTGHVKGYMRESHTGVSHLEERSSQCRKRGC